MWTNWGYIPSTEHIFSMGWGSQGDLTGKYKADIKSPFCQSCKLLSLTTCNVCFSKIIQQFLKIYEFSFFRFVHLVCTEWSLCQYFEISIPWQKPSSNLVAGGGLYSITRST